MFGLHQQVAKTLVWLAAILMPLQVLPSAKCWCAGERRERIDSGAAPRHHVQKTCCCYRTVPVQAAYTRGEDESCCPKANSSPESSCCGGSLTCTCFCQENDSSPAVPPAPTETRCRSVVDLLQLPAPVCLSLEKSQPRSAQQRPAFHTSASERCISLCRFLL